MNPDRITQLRQLLKKARKVFWNDEGWTWYKVNTADVLPLIDQALALLPCPTCNGTKLPKVQSPGAVCPDCK